MLINHSFQDKSIQKDVPDAGFLLTNKKGGFANFGVNTKYRGVFFRLRDEVYKIIDDIRIKGQISEIHNGFWHVSRKRGDNTEKFFMPHGMDCFVYELENESTVDVLFDVKKAYDSRVWGRNYRVWQEDDALFVEFKKFTDKREDDSEGEMEFQFTIAILGKFSDVEILDRWEHMLYTADAQRHSGPYDRHVYNGFKARAKQLFFSFGETKEDALKNCQHIKKKLSHYRSLQEKYSGLMFKKAKDDKTQLALKAATEALDSLLVHDDIYAGLPWFFQFWGRDTFISLKALMLDNEFSMAKKVLLKYLEHIEEDGLVPNRVPPSGIQSIDASGWFFTRWQNFFTLLGEEKTIQHYFSKGEVELVITRLKSSMNQIFKNYTVDSLAVNNAQETWMDTNIGDGRAGKRIEIQALRFRLYTFLAHHSDKNFFDDLAARLKTKIKEVFWTGTYLKDGADDPTIRPNIFIAAYLAPELLSKEEWIACFDHILPKLWLDWGGLSTIDKEDPRFRERSTGENPESYHHGDSWYWINNLAALVLTRLDYVRYQHTIEKIVEASCEDILFKGYVGCHSEISSAVEQKAEGCLNQAWSNAFFIELIEELNKR
ncbi:hypothetical protein GOV09_03295 [Candidatus Woesearchaeota archaeon]|nr:hypothetical protein [Candidatus Woesearchaeota archaeon]